MEQPRKPSASVMSKKKLNEIGDALKELITDEAMLTLAMERICEIMKFDPNEKRYTKEMGKRTVAWRQKKAQELGVTTYELSGRKKHYEQSKLAI